MCEKKLLYFTNTPSHYRIPFYRELCKIYPVKIIFIDFDLANRIYGIKVSSKDLTGIDYTCIDKNIARSQIKKIFQNDSIKAVIVPTMDSLYEARVALIIYYYAIKYKKKILYFWEKWEAPISKQPLERRVRNIVQKVLLKIIDKKCDIFLAGGSKTKEYFLIQGIAEEKCKTILNVSMIPTCDCTNWKEEAGIPKEKIILLYFGRLIERKGIKYLIDSLQQLSLEDINNNLWLVIAGEGDVRKYYSKYAEKKDIKNISWIGFIPPSRRYDYFSQCDIFILPSYFHKGIVEAWGLTINEAIECGKVCITTKSVGSAYDLISDENGIIVNPESSVEIADAIKKIIETDLIQTAYIKDEEVIRKYNYESSVKSFVEILSNLIE